MNLYLSVKVEGVSRQIRALTNFLAIKNIRYCYNDNISSYKDLKDTYCRSNGIVPIRQSMEAGEVFCGSHHLNDLVRVVHDHTHIKYDFTFSVAGELNTALHTHIELRSRVSKDLNDLIFIDTVSQIYYYNRYKKYVADQDTFLRDICHRITVGSLEEMKNKIMEVI